ncbi:hypothetical protein LTR37_015937 [Vermiconidia calcicola]|uniref:Uncharacterized protein n=1 Tax=Vermiconidia calcicola TaxID=1690605 RepID=A0ACC3MRZ5_9PEZI|nr:hypothetical protein LTR37_015937 [Vermiconidia calcicola]
MSIPQPPTKVEGHCSAIVDNTLHVLSPNSFLSLPLEEHAQWQKEKLGVPVTGAACVQAGDAFYAVGGTTDDDSYSGLQRYSFANKSWETLKVADSVLQGRTDHSVAYLEESRQILVYAGSQPDAPSDLSSQTFVISTESEGSIEAYTSLAPPGNLPILQPWNTSHALMLGGSHTNTQVYTFGLIEGWQPYSVRLAAPVDSSSRATIINGADGSKVLQLYDMGASPNRVTQIVLQGAYGEAAYTGQTVGSRSPSRKRKRDLTLDSWPTYNDANALTTTRTDYSVAQGSDGMTVIAGGNSEAPVAIFNHDRNSWVNADKFFGSKQRQQPLQPSKSDSSPSAATPTSSSSPSATSKGSDSSSGESSHDRMMRTLGITLGVLCGIAAIFILVLLFLRWRKIKRRKEQGYLDEKNNEDDRRMSFADRGASFMKEAGGSVNGLEPPASRTWNEPAAGSHSSLAMFGGKLGGKRSTANQESQPIYNPPPHLPPNNKRWNEPANASHSSLAIIAGKFNGKRNTTNHEPKPSYDSTSRLVRDKDRTAMRGEPVELVNLDEKKIERKPVPRHEPTPPAPYYGPTLTEDDAKNNVDARDGRNRSSGWSKYFATSQPTGPNGLSHLPTAYAKSNTYSDGSMYSSDQTSRQPSQIPSSALVPPLDIDFSRTVDGQRLSHVTSGSPAFNDSREDLAQHGTLAPEGQRGLIVNPADPNRTSGTDTISSYNTYNRSTMSSTMTGGDYYNESGSTPWSPTGTNFKDLLNSRPPSSVYGGSASEQRVPSRGKSAGFFPGSGITYRPSPKSKPKVSHSTVRNSDWPVPPMNHASLKAAKPAEERDSTMTVFPKGVPSAYYDGRHKEQEPAKPVNTDLSWLNLDERQARPGA